MFFFLLNDPFQRVFTTVPQRYNGNTSVNKTRHFTSQNATPSHRRSKLVSAKMGRLKPPQLSTSPGEPWIGCGRLQHGKQHVAPRTKVFHMIYWYTLYYLYIYIFDLSIMIWHLPCRTLKKRCQERCFLFWPSRTSWMGLGMERGHQFHCWAISIRAGTNTVRTTKVSSKTEVMILSVDLGEIRTDSIM